MHLHLDPVGGVAGDMFAAALIDLDPEAVPELERAFEDGGLSSWVTISAHRHSDLALAGHRFQVHLANRKAQRTHHAYSQIRAFLDNTTLTSPVRARARAIFDLLAQAEARVHGVAPEQVSFHEVGQWDSIADVVAAAWFVERFAGASWSCGALPLGAGQVPSAHGRLPLPAPATAVLLEGYPVYQDGIAGERVTPTGAAIIRYLEPDFTPVRGILSLAGSGIGHGTRELTGVSNILRVLSFEQTESACDGEQIAVCQFEVDDQSPEDLAVAMENLRHADGVLDVIQTPVIGKKGRLASQVQVLARPERLRPTLNRCFLETTTLGIRWHEVERVLLERTQGEVEVRGRRVRVKRARRPNATVTEKAEIADLARESGGYSTRERLRRESEQLASARDQEEEGDFGAGLD